MRTRLTAFLAVALGMAGCTSSPNIVGKWVLDSASQNSGATAGNDLAKSFAKLNSIEFRADKSFTRTLLVSLAGTYEVRGNTVTLKYTTAMGMDISKMSSGNDPAKRQTQTGTISADGKSLSLADDGGKLTTYVRETP